MSIVFIGEKKKKKTLSFNCGRDSFLIKFKTHFQDHLKAIRAGRENIRQRRLIRTVQLIQFGVAVDHIGNAVVHKFPQKKGQKEGAEQCSS